MLNTCEDALAEAGGKQKLEAIADTARCEHRWGAPLPLCDLKPDPIDTLKLKPADRDVFEQAVAIALALDDLTFGSQFKLVWRTKRTSLMCRNDPLAIQLF